MTTKGGLQRRQQRQTLFAQRRQITANASKGLSESLAPEAAGDFLLDLDHAKISLGQIIVKIHPKILQEGEDGLLLFAQAIQQIASVTLFASTPFPRGSRCPRVRLIPVIEQTEKLCFPIHDFQRVKPALSLLARLLCRLFHIQQEGFEVCSPLDSLLCEKHEVAQQMHNASSMLTVVQEVRSPSVVDRDPCKMRQNPDGFQCGLTSARIDVIVGEGRRAGHMHPVPFACHIQPGFILMDDLRLFQRLGDLLLHRGQLSRTPFDQVTDGPFTHLDSQQVAHHLTGTGQWQQLLFGPIFPYHHSRRWQIHDLATLSSTRCHRVQVVLARFAPFYLLEGDLIWRRRELQARSLMSWLPARFLLAFLAQAFRCAHKPIRGRRQVAIVAIFREPISQGFQLLAQAAHLLTVLLDHSVLLREQLLLLLDGFIPLRQLFSQNLILFSQIDQFFFDRHALTLLGLTPFGKSPAHLGSYQRIALAEMNQAYNLAWLGNFEEAYHLQQQALNHFISLGETDLIVNAEVNLADLDYAQGYYGSALRRYYQARDIFIQNNLDDPALLAELKLYIANCLVKLNRPQEACGLANEAVALYRQFNIPLSLGKALPEYATTLATSGRLEEALTTLDEAWTILDEGKFDSYASATKLRQAELFLTKGDIGEAYHQACLLRNYFDDKGMGSYSVRASLVVVGALIEKSKQARSQQMEGQQDAFLQEALLLCKQVVSQARQYNLQEEAYKSHYLLGRLYVLQGSPGK